MPAQPLAFPVMECGLKNSNSPRSAAVSHHGCAFFGAARLISSSLENVFAGFD
jgi:hypothetical protein